MLDNSHSVLWHIGYEDAKKAKELFYMGKSFFPEVTLIPVSEDSFKVPNMFAIILHKLVPVVVFRLSG